MLIVIKWLTWMASPIGIFIWGFVLALMIFLLRWRKTSMALAIIAAAQLIAFSTATISDALLGSLEDRARVLEAKSDRATKLLNAERYGAIVILGGAMGPAFPPKRPFPDLTDAADRIWHAARLYRHGISNRIIVSGGRGPGMEDRSDIASEAASIRQMLIDLGVPAKAIVLEESSRTTNENAEFTKKLVANQRVALVTSAFHMPRALGIFQKAGVTVDAFPTDFRVSPETDPGWSRWLPRSEYLQRSEMALKEYLALAIHY